jgi:hypothetical protein
VSFIYGLKSTLWSPNFSRMSFTSSSISLSIPKYGVVKYYHGMI